MFRNKTVMVIGAGASVEVGLPDGPKLAKEIGPSVNFYFDAGMQRSGDGELWNALKIHAQKSGERTLEKYLLAGRRINAAMLQASSIDAFMASNPEDKAIELVGRLAIV